MMIAIVERDAINYHCDAHRDCRAAARNDEAFSFRVDVARND